MTTTMIRFDKLIKRYDGVAALKGISGQVRRGDIVALLGKNGAGKTTLMETLLGFTPADSGDITVLDYAPLHFDGDVKQRLGYVPQQDDLLANLSVAAWLNLIAQFYPRWDLTLQNRLLREWELPLDKRMAKLSVGQRQKVSILSGICHRPDLLVLDEPVASLDPIARRQFLETLIAMADEHQQTILFSTHIVSDVERIASRVWLMREGELVVDNGLDALKESVIRLHGPLDKLTTLRSGLEVVNARQRAEHQTLIVKNWSPELQNKADHLALTVEPLSLEDIFVEMHA